MKVSGMRERSGLRRKPPGFNAQDAWDLITRNRGGTFKTSSSKGYHIAKPVLHFAQVFKGYNLLGQTSAALTTPELYFTWSMMKGVKVHLGYWLAHACNSMTSHTVRHLYTCHLLGAYLQRNVIMTVAKSVPSPLVYDAPEVFDETFFINKGLLQMKDGEVVFYEVGKPDVTTVKRELEWPEASSNAERDEWRRELKEVWEGISEVRKEVNELKENIAELNRNVGKHSDRMADAVRIMMRMADWLDKKFPQTQQPLPPRPSGVAKQLGQGTSSLKKAQTTPTSSPTQQRKQVIAEPSTVTV